ncbi:hypothetical protein L228DRAFT_238533 [Xylona heveae TC161]|uniref:Ribonucleases P/MRP subunit Pop8-like domain-containing protein n=1 Tax=Xylona heveae (strain CBS 132557 / TC161) TaxID=1328760 RepID=A0A165GU37_XYLHT|nr:hypothetical protein L228DRAFT_238533 [Xylona heveae TC161]KZF22599.1 hypothetical protein L228DRAFT_238533 [Xylona heveae TC161]
MTAVSATDRAPTEPQPLQHISSETRLSKKRLNDSDDSEETEDIPIRRYIGVPLKQYQPWAYLQLELLFAPPSSAPPSVDNITVRTNLTTALHQFLGLTGTAIPIDLLKVQGRQAWLRVAQEDMGAVVAAVSGWVGGGGTTADAESIGWRVHATGNWLAGMISGGGQELFHG